MNGLYHLPSKKEKKLCKMSELNPVLTFITGKKEENYRFTLDAFSSVF